MKCCGSERRRLRPCEGPRPRWRRARVGGPCPKARAGRDTPRRPLPCARRPGPAPLCSGNERPSGAACSSRELRTAGAGHGGLQVGVAAGQLTGSARGHGCRLPAAGSWRLSAGQQRSSSRVRPSAGGRFGLGLLGEMAQERLFLVKCDSLSRSSWLFSFFLHYVSLLWFLFPL